MLDEKKVYVNWYTTERFRGAKRLLAEAEREFDNTKNQTVLVKTESLKELKRTYPNYYSDTAHFTTVLEKFLLARVSS